MSNFCPSLVVLLSAALAGRLVIGAGGLQILSTTPSQSFPLVAIQIVTRSSSSSIYHGDFNKIRGRNSVEVSVGIPSNYSQASSSFCPQSQIRIAGPC